MLLARVDFRVEVVGPPGTVDIRLILIVLKIV